MNISKTLQSLATNANVGRGGDYAPLAKSVAILNDMLANGWQADSVLLVSEQTAPCQSVIDMVLEVLSNVEEDSKGKLPKYKIGGKSYSVAELEDAVSSLALDTTAQGKIILAGHTRTVALVLGAALEILPSGLSPIVNVSKNETLDAVRSNLAHSLATKLDKVQRLQTALTLFEEGKIQSQSECRLLYKDGIGQTVWVQLQAVSHAGLPVEAAAELKSDSTTREAIKMPASNAKKALEAVISEAPEAKNKVKAVSGPSLLAMASRFPEWSDLLTYLANGQQVSAEGFIRSHTVSPVVPDGAESLS